MSAAANFDAVVFDYDDTIADTIPARIEATRLAFDEAGLVCDAAQFVYATRGIPLQTALDAADGGRGKLLGLTAIYRRHYWGKEPGLIRLFDGVRDLLDALAERAVPLGILTSKLRDTPIEGRRAGAVVELEELGVDGRFPCVVGFEDVANAKPHPEGLERVIACLGADPARTLVVGDSWADLEVARNGGAKSCLATWGLDDPAEQLARVTPDFIIDAPFRLLDLL